jgi:hypothetical protein
MIEGQDGPHCVFCGALWTAEMLRLYDAGTNGAVCACCVIFPDLAGFEPEPAPVPREHVPLPPELSCQTCGRVLYRLFSPDPEGDSVTSR